MCLNIFSCACLTFYIFFGKMSIQILCHEHRISLHLFGSSLISFISTLQFSAYRSFMSLVKYIPRYFIVFDVIVNGILVFLFLFLIVCYQCIGMLNTCVLI